MQNEKEIWSWLKNNTDLNDYAIAGIMGNIESESAGSPINLENRANTILKMTDEEYTQEVDSGKYTRTDFATDHGTYGGYGLCQWTYYTRKLALYDWCKGKGVSIGNLEAQLAFMVNELKNQYKVVWDVLCTAKSVQEASDVVLLKYENPASAQAQKATRAGRGMAFYNRYHGVEVIASDNITGKLEQLSNLVHQVSDLLNEIISGM